MNFASKKLEHNLTTATTVDDWNRAVREYNVFQDTFRKELDRQYDIYLNNYALQLSATANLSAETTQLSANAIILEALARALPSAYDRYVASMAPHCSCDGYSCNDCGNDCGNDSCGGDSSCIDSSSCDCSCDSDDCDNDHGCSCEADFECLGDCSSYCDCGCEDDGL